MPNVVVQDDGSVTVVIVDEPTIEVNAEQPSQALFAGQGSVVVQEVDITGIKGDKGDKGDQGDPGQTGPPGASAINPIVFHQATPEAIWLIPHGLNTYPLVTVVDSANQTVMGDVSYPDLNTVQLTFSAPFSGTAYLL